MRIDLRKELDKTIEEYGHFILLQRASSKLKCRCWNELRKEGDRSCPYCLGRGWVSRIERHKVRFNSAVSTMTRPMLTTLSPVGESWVDAKEFYFRYNVDVKAGDFIYEVGWSKNNPLKPTHLIRAYVVNDMYEYRGDNGRIEYKGANVRRETSAMDIRNIVIRSLGPIQNYEILK